MEPRLHLAVFGDPCARSLAGADRFTHGKYGNLLHTDDTYAVSSWVMQRGSVNLTRSPSDTVRFN